MPQGEWWKIFILVILNNGACTVVIHMSHVPPSLSRCEAWGKLNPRWKKIQNKIFIAAAYSPLEQLESVV